MKRRVYIVLDQFAFSLNHPTHESCEVMDSKLYKRLDECNAQGSWDKIRDIIAVQLMGMSLIENVSEKSLCLETPHVAASFRILTL